jgi:hypothetical protein
MTHRNYTLVFLVSLFMFILATAGFNYYVDPFTYYHLPWTKINLDKNHRVSNPGLARQFNYQTALVGTSHVQELETSRLTEIMGRPAINLSLSGALINEQAKLIKVILQAGKADRVLWEMNFPSFAFGDIVGASGNEFPEYFYSPSIDTPLRYLISFDTLSRSREALHNPGRITLDNRNQISRRDFSEQRVIQDWLNRLLRWNSRTKQMWAEAQSQIKQPDELIRELIAPLITANPQVKFDLFLPPGSLLLFLVHKNMGASDFDRWLDWRDSLGALSEQHQNLSLHDFQADKEISANLDLFRDIEHFNREVLEGIFHKIRDETYKVDGPQVRRNTIKLKLDVENFGRNFCADPSHQCPD